MVMGSSPHRYSCGKGVAHPVAGASCSLLHSIPSPLKGRLRPHLTESTLLQQPSSLSVGLGWAENSQAAVEPPPSHTYRGYQQEFSFLASFNNCMSMTDKYQQANLFLSLHLYASERQQFNITINK